MKFPQAAISVAGGLTLRNSGFVESRSQPNFVLPAYTQLLVQLKEAGVEWVQVDEPILGLDLPPAWRNAFEPCYWQLNQAGARILLATYFSPLEENLSLACRLPVAGLHVDGVRARQELVNVCDWLPVPKVLSVGIVDGRNIWRTDLDAAVSVLRPLRERRGGQLWLAPSCSLLHVPFSLAGETALDPELASWLAFATEKLDELAALKAALDGDGAAAALAVSRDAIASRARSTRVHSDQVARELAAGAYTAVISGFNSIFRNGDIVPGSHRGGHYRLGIQASQPVSTPQAPDYLAADGNLLTAAIQEIELGSGWLAAGAIRRLEFTLTDDIGGGDWLAIHTAGSGIDTEIGLYDAQGDLVATNDDVNSQTRTSRLAFGLDGDNGRALSAGQYTLLLGGFNTIFEDWAVAASSATTAGNYSVHLQRTAAAPPDDIFIQDPAVVAEPSPFALSGIALALAFVARRKRSSATSGTGCIRNDISVSLMKHKKSKRQSQDDDFSF